MTTNDTHHTPPGVTEAPPQTTPPVRRLEVAEGSNIPCSPRNMALIQAGLAMSTALLAKTEGLVKGGVR